MNIFPNIFPNIFSARCPRNALQALGLVLPLLFSGMSHAAIFQAEDYNEYYDSTSGNTGGQYRNDDVDIEKTLDPEGGAYNVAWITKNEWLTYGKLTIPKNGKYTIRMRVASQNGATASVDLNGGNIELGSLKIPATHGRQNWITVSIDSTIQAGTYDLGVFAQTGGWSFNWIEVIPTQVNTSSSLSKSSVVSSSSKAISSSKASSLSSIVLSSQPQSSKATSSQPISSVASSIAVSSKSVVASSSKSSVASSKATSSKSSQIISSSVASSTINSSASSNNAPAGYTLVWSDEFDKNGLPDSTKWNYDTEANATGWYNNEKQYYAVANLDYSEVKDGKLIITAKKEALISQPDYGGQAYTSARLITNGKATWTYGFFETRAKLPCGKGSWPAIWMLGLGEWPASGEIDIMEQVGSAPSSIEGTIWTSASLGTNGDGSVTQVKDACDNFHNYQLTWTPESLVIAVDNKPYHTYKNSGNGPTVWPFDKPMYFLLNLAIGGDMGGPVDDSIFPIHYEIEYVKIYQKL